MANWSCKHFIWIDTIQAVIWAMIGQTYYTVSDPRVNEALKALLLWTNFIMDVELIAHKFFLVTSLMFNFCERSCQLKSVSQEVQKQKRPNITKATFLKNSSMQS